MNARFGEPDYRLLWSRDLFVQVASDLLNRRNLVDWDVRCELLLLDAFVESFDGPLSEFRDLSPREDQRVQAIYGQASGLTARQNFLLQLIRGADALEIDDLLRRPYWSRRTAGENVQVLRQDVMARRFVSLVAELDQKGYLEKSFGKDCIDQARGNSPSRIIEHLTGIAGLWPLDEDRLGRIPGLFCDVIEALHDLVARPTSRWNHSIGGCGWHHGSFEVDTGREVYRWRVNQLLGQSDLGLCLADAGEDIGRLVTAPSDSRSELVEQLVASDGDTGDQVRHAVALFRRRGADRNDKRSAVVSLARVLENKRKLLRAELLSKDEDALFLIANRFDIRHQNEAQKSDYDEFFLDWIYWWYLATIELADRLADRKMVPPGGSKPATPSV